ncbi:MAG: hypothetical protein AABX07_00550 [Nanoarchaeota archaeon]
MKKTLSSLLLGFSLISNYAPEPSPLPVEPKRYAEHTLEVPDYQVTVRTYDSDLDGEVDGVRLVYVKKKDKSVLAPSFFIYSRDLDKPGCHPDFTRWMTEEQATIFTELHNGGSKTNGLQKLVDSSVLQPIGKKTD